MVVIDPYFYFMSVPESDYALELIEKAGRTCYKSEDKIAPGTAEKLVNRLIASGHESVLEHVNITVRIVCDRGVSHELVRQRICSFSQESTRYANYAGAKFNNEITVIKPFFWETDLAKYNTWLTAMLACEKAYLSLIAAGASAQEARSVLPNSLKTEVVMTTNIREWRHIFKLRCDKAAHPQMRQIMLPMLREFKERLPVFFDDLIYN